MPAHFSATKAAWKVSASTARPKTAQVSQIASPIHIATRNGSTAPGPRESTRATSAAIDGPGEPAATVSAAAKASREAASSMGGSIGRRGRRWNGQRGLRPAMAALGSG